MLGKEEGKQVGGGESAPCKPNTGNIATTLRGRIGKMLKVRQQDPQFHLK
jgi:hypothetical protein